MICFFCPLNKAPSLYEFKTRQISEANQFLAITLSKFKLFQLPYIDLVIEALENSAYEINKNSENEQRCGKRNEQITQKNATNNKEKSNK